jgi:hypothetical protein
MPVPPRPPRPAVTTSSSSAAPLRWNAPPPSAVLDWQRRQEVFTRTNLCQMILAESIHNGSWTTTAALPPGTDPADFAAQVLMLSESKRLREARTYSIGPNTTGLVVAATATSAPREQISMRRAPSPSGLMFFNDPIGSEAARHRTNCGQELEIHTPIVAVSWSMWNGEQSRLLGDDLPLTWIRHSPARGFVPLAPNERGIWMTFYAARTGDTPDIDPEAPVAVDLWGEAVTARQSAEADQAFRRRNPQLWGPLGWHNEFFLPEGETFPLQLNPGSVQQWAATVYTTWQIMRWCRCGLVHVIRR